MKVAKLSIWSFAVTLSIILSGCAGKSIKQQRRNSYGILKSLLAHQALRDKDIYSLKGTALMRPVEAGKRGIRADAVIQVHRNGNFRIDAYDPLGRTQFVLLSDGVKIAYYLKENEEVWVGDYDQRDFIRALPVPLTGSQIVHFLLGEPPSLPIVKKSQVRWIKKDVFKLCRKFLSGSKNNLGAIQVNVKGPDIFMLPRASGNTIRSWKRGPLEVCMAGYEKVKNKNFYFPEQMLAFSDTDPGKPDGLLFYWKDVDWNEKLNPDLFNWKKLVKKFGVKTIKQIQ